ncbi:hypothetical protein IWX87_000621 [Polaromonas sp. CG_9.7]|nr:hypothetical protein [Polaromonas sp. CG_9.7]MBG6112813.1 hypothetical protein [Polaromonas sp. CG_9.2]
MGMFCEGEPAGVVCAQRLAMARRDGQPAFGIESEK